MDPPAFALIYLPHHVHGDETGSQVTFSKFHLDLIEQAKRWNVPDEHPAQHRDAYVDPLLRQVDLAVSHPAAVGGGSQLAPVRGCVR
jgi:hypothetical protein